MKRLFHTLLIGGCLLLGGCQAVTDWLYPKVYFKSFVWEYANVDHSKEAEVAVYSSRDIEVALPFYAYARQNVREKEDASSQELHAKHQQISQANGDLYYNKWFEDNDSDFEHFTTVWNTDKPFSAITIVSDADYDEAHPKGTPLNDVIDISYYTYRHYIKNGYKHAEDRVEHSDCRNPWGDMVTKTLSEWDAEDSLFMDYIAKAYGTTLRPNPTFILGFTSEPTIEQLHHFTGTINIEGNPQPYTFEFDVDFTSAE